MKASLDMNSIKEFGIQHAEKFVLGLVVLLFLILAAQAIANMGKGPPFTPEQLAAAADQAQQSWQGTDPQSLLKGEDLVAYPYSKEAERLRIDVPLPPYELPVPPNRPVIDQAGKRGMPALLALEDVRAEAGNGALQASSAMGMPGAAGPMPMPAEDETMIGAGPVGTMTGRGVRGARFVVVTALVPIQKQMEAFKVAFQDAAYRNPQTDIPMYLGYRVLRAEVGESPPEDSDFKPIDIWKSLLATGYGRAGGQDVVDRRYYPMQPPWARIPMVAPLPPLTNRAWGPEVAHYPEIPLFVDMPKSQLGRMGQYFPGMEVPAEGAAPGAEGVAPGEAGKVSPEQAEPFPGLPELMGPGGPGGLGPGGIMGAPGGAYPGAGGYAGEMMGMGAMPGMGPMPGMGAMPGMAAGPYPGTGTGMYGEEGGPYGYPMGGYGYGATGPSGVAGQMQPLEYQLFRFFDFDVQPGKSYQYRVQALLSNPNYEKFVPERYLEDKNLGKNWWVAAEMSQPSEVVTVPFDSRLVAGAVKPPPTILYEPSAQVVVVTLRMEDGLEAAGDYIVARGHLANFEGTISRGPKRGLMGMPMGPSMEYEDPMMMMYGEGMYPGAAGPKEARKPAKKEEEEKITHATGMLVLDLLGGERLHRSDRDLTEPGSLLLMDPEGNLYVRNELADQEEYRKFHAEEEKKAKPAEKMAPPGMEGAEYMYDMYMGTGEEGPRGRRGRDRTRRNEGT